MAGVIFLPCSLDGLSRLSASIRWRAAWPAEAMGADVYDGTQRIFEYDAVVFQKLYLGQFALDLAQGLRQRGKILAFDVCDADWLQSGTHKERLLRILPLMDFAVAPTEPLAEWLRGWLPAYVIPDRIKSETHRSRGAHRERKTPSLVWFGNRANLATLEPLWKGIQDLGLPLTIITDVLPKPWVDRPVRFVAWTLQGANREIRRHSIALNPRLETGRFRFKSHNKALTAWALGLPVARTVAEIEGFLDWRVRNAEVKRRQAEVAERWDVRHSAPEWERLFTAYRRGSQ